MQSIMFVFRVIQFRACAIINISFSLNDDNNWFFSHRHPSIIHSWVFVPEYRTDSIRYFMALCRNTKCVRTVLLGFLVFLRPNLKCVGLLIGIKLSLREDVCCEWCPCSPHLLCSSEIWIFWVCNIPLFIFARI